MASQGFLQGLETELGLPVSCADIPAGIALHLDDLKKLLLMFAWDG
jgi:hypothetical protein